MRSLKRDKVSIKLVDFSDEISIERRLQQYKVQDHQNFLRANALQSNITGAGALSDAEADSPLLAGTKNVSANIRNIRLNRVKQAQDLHQ